MQTKFFALFLIVIFSLTAVFAQRPNGPLDLSPYGIKIDPDKRLIVMMAALEAAGLDVSPVNPTDKTPKEPVSKFREQVRSDLASLNPDLKRKMQEFFRRTNQTFNRKTPAEQVAPFISLAYVLTNVPELGEPSRTDNIPSEALEVLDFAPLLREFYRRSNIEANMPTYIRAYQAVGDDSKFRLETARMAQELLDYLHTKPQTIIIEKITTTGPSTSKKRSKLQQTETREKERHFNIVPDLLAVPDTLNFRVSRDDYYAIVNESVNPRNSELRRAYLQFVFETLVLKNSKDIVPMRDRIKSLLDQIRLSQLEKLKATKPGATLDDITISPDVFIAITRSLIAATDAKQIEFQKVTNATEEARLKIDLVKDTPGKLAISDKLKEQKAAWADETALQLSDAYEKGAVLSFYFADQFKGMEESGFDIASSFRDMILSLDVTKETDRLAKNSDARKRALLAREARRKKAEEEYKNAVKLSDSDKYLADNLSEINELLKIKNFDSAKARIDVLQSRTEFSNDSRVFYTLGRLASLRAQDAFDEGLRNNFLTEAAGFYKKAIDANTKTSDKNAVFSLAHVGLGRILEFNEQNAAALAEYDAAIKLGNMENGAYIEALRGKQRLSAKP